MRRLRKKSLTLLALTAALLAAGEAKASPSASESNAERPAVKTEDQLGASETAHGTDEISEEANWIEEAANGEIHMLPSFSWNSDRSGDFIFSYRLINRSDMDVPEVEVRLLLPQNGAEKEIYFRGGREKEKSREYIVRLSELRQGEERKDEVRGHLDVGAEEACGEKSADFSGGDLQLSLILRGHGLEHATYAAYPIPPFEKPAPLARQVRLLVVNLIRQGKESPAAKFVEATVTEEVINRVQASEGSKLQSRRMNFMSMKEGKIYGMYNALRKTLLPLFFALLMMLISGKISARLQLKKAEKRKKFNRRRR